MRSLPGICNYRALAFKSKKKFSARVMQGGASWLITVHGGHWLTSFVEFESKDRNASH
jgi:hypothetical protein